MPTIRKLIHTLSVLTLCGIMLTAGLSTAGCSHGRFNNMISKSDEIDMGRDISKQVDSQSKLISSGPQYDQLQRVGDRILPLAKKDFDVPYSVKLINSKEVNAFSVPGGPIYFYKGLMDLMDDDDQVASVLGHEATHTVKRHVARQISDAQTKSLITQIALGHAGGLVQTLAGLGLQLQQLKFSRGDEAEADANGFRYLVQAGYTPEAMAQTFKKLQEQEGKNGGGPEWTQNHPLTAKRIENAEKWATDYRKSGTLP